MISSGRASLVGALLEGCAAAQQEAGEESRRGGGDVKRINLARPESSSLRALLASAHSKQSQRHVIRAAAARPWDKSTRRGWSSCVAPPASSPTAEAKDARRQIQGRS